MTRVAKTTVRQVADLEDHLSIADDGLIRTLGGELHFLKPLTAELRVLACYSSGTEGLLWRVADALGSGSSVENARITFKTKMVGNSAGPWYTFETLVQRASQQLGSAHEDDGAEPGLIELERTQVGHLSALAYYVVEAARMCLQCGHLLLDVAQREAGFQRRWYLDPNKWTLAPGLGRMRLEQRPPQFMDEPRCAPPEGTISFWLRHEHDDWQTNGNAYDFGVVTGGTVAISTAKEPDRCLVVVVCGVLPCDAIFRVALGEPEGPRVMVAVAWDTQSLTLYVNGRSADTRSRH